MIFPFRTRTKFERNLFVSILLIAIALCGASVLSLVVAQHRFESLLQQLWLGSGGAPLRRDLAYFARGYLNELAECGAASLKRASADCPRDSAEVFLDCVVSRLTQVDRHEDMAVRQLQLYEMRGGEWAFVAERGTAEPANASGDPHEGRQPFRLRPADLEHFARTGRQPLQRAVGLIASVSQLERLGAGSAALVLVSATDSTVTKNWQRSMASVDSPSFAPLFSDLIRLQIVSLLIALAIVGLVAVIVSRVLAVRVSRPLAELVDAMERVGSGDLDYRAVPGGQQEFRLLVESFNTMTDSIQRLNEETRHTARLKRELEMAREIQLKLLPNEIPQPDGYSIYGTNVPSLEMSGDYFDVLRWGDKEDLALVIGDVSGKGVPAAMVMANAQACLHSQSLNPDANISDSFKTLNRVVLENTDDSTFVTFFFALLSPSRGTLSYVNGGHNPPILLRKNGELLELGASGPIVGVLPHASYEPGQLDLSSGDLLFMYTDGVTEATSPDDEEFGTERLRELLHHSRRQPAEQITRSVVDAVEQYTGSDTQADDITILVVKATSP
ncbi:MAG: PP2C family protein-serine/threonine phosphatase [Candidatus Latescibacterota bacterium]|nr:MAG: PP2C family protein-serine/threonine phosphatase [Candidatus Latescibacterota bacterium]